MLQNKINQVLSEYSDAGALAVDDLGKNLSRALVRVCVVEGALAFISCLRQ